MDDTPDQGMIRFRLRARTQFRNRQGEWIRDSPLKPANQLEVPGGAGELELGCVVAFCGKARRLQARRPHSPGGRSTGDALPCGSETGSGDRGRPRLLGLDGRIRFRAGFARRPRRAALAKVEAAMRDFFLDQATKRCTSFHDKACWNLVDRIEAWLAWTGGKEE